MNLEFERMQGEGSNTKSTLSVLSHSEDLSPFEDESECCMVNSDRLDHNPQLHALTHSSELHALAKWHAENMAADKKVNHIAPSDALARTTTAPLAKQLGQNISRGKDFVGAYRKMITDASKFCNIIDPEYREIGMATAQGKDGKTYMCLVFRG